VTRLTINVLGRDITGTIAKLQEVDFSSRRESVYPDHEPASADRRTAYLYSTVYNEPPKAEAPDPARIWPRLTPITAIRVRDAIDRSGGGGLAGWHSGEHLHGAAANSF